MLFFSFALGIWSQGNLQFNQVVTHTGSGSGSYSYVSPTWTVPAGKVWKVESASPNLGNAALTRAINVNSGVDWGSYRLTSSGQDLSVSPFPIWLMAGDQVQLEASGNCCYATSFSYAISVVEFNIVP